MLPRWNPHSFAWCLIGIILVAVLGWRLVPVLIEILFDLRAYAQVKLWVAFSFFMGAILLCGWSAIYLIFSAFCRLSLQVDGDDLLVVRAWLGYKRVKRFQLLEKVTMAGVGGLRKSRTPGIAIWLGELRDKQFVLDESWCSDLSLVFSWIEKRVQIPCWDKCATDWVEPI